VPTLYSGKARLCSAAFVLEQIGLLPNPLATLEYSSCNYAFLSTLKTVSLCGSFTSISERDNDVLDTTSRTQDEIHEVLLGLFYPWNMLRDLLGGLVDSLRALEYRNTWLWNLLIPSLPLYVVQLSENVILLRRSKETGDQDRKERGIEFDDYLEAINQDVYNDKEEANIDFNFATL
jgi:hypothetical protein